MKRLLTEQENMAIQKEPIYDEGVKGVGLMLRVNILLLILMLLAVA